MNLRNVMLSIKSTSEKDKVEYDVISNVIYCASPGPSRKQKAPLEF